MSLRDFFSNIYGLLTKHAVKMAGYWPSSFSVCFWTEMDSRSINSQKKNEANTQQFLPKNLGQKRIYYLPGFRANFSRGTQRVVPSGQDSSILPAGVANHSTRFNSSCPLMHGASHIINLNPRYFEN